MTATCACGQASITVNSAPKMLGACHCTNCKRRTGSAFGISAYFERSAVTAQKGETQIYAFHHAAQAHDQERHFCKSCGTTLFWYISTLPDQIGIAGGCFAEQGLPQPTYSVNDHKREAWVALPLHWQAYTEAGQQLEALAEFGMVHFNIRDPEVPIERRWRVVVTLPSVQKEQVPIGSRLQVATEVGAITQGTAA